MTPQLPPQGPPHARGGRCPSLHDSARVAMIVAASILAAGVARAESSSPGPSWWQVPDFDESLAFVGDWIAQSEAKTRYRAARAACRSRREAEAQQRPAPDLENAGKRWRAALVAREGTAIRLDGGARLLIVPWSHLGGVNDLWLVRRERDGTIGAPRFLGLNPPSVRRGRSFHQLVRGSVQRGVLTLCERGREGRVVRIALEDLDRDRDADGLTDLVERRLHLDPTRSDTDGDTLDDSHDLAPNASVQAPSEEEDLIALEIVNATLADEQAPPGSVVVVYHHRALEWRVPGRPVITLPPTDGERPRDLRGACNISLEPLAGSAGGDQSALGPADAATRDWEISHFRDGCGSVRTCRVRLGSEGWRLQGERPDVFL